MDGGLEKGRKVEEKEEEREKRTWILPSTASLSFFPSPVPATTKRGLSSAELASVKRAASVGTLSLHQQWRRGSAQIWDATIDNSRCIIINDDSLQIDKIILAKVSEGMVLFCIYFLASNHKIILPTDES